jgi:hypothetical protein
MPGIDQLHRRRLHIGAPNPPACRLRPQLGMRVCRSRYARKAISGVPIARLGRFSQRCLWGSKTPVWLRDLGVFVDQATEGFPASDPCLLDVDHAWERAGFSPARRMTSLRMSRRVDGRPECPARHLAAHRRRSRSRCQRKIVSGVTTSRNPVRRGLRITLVNAAISPRSARCQSWLAHLLPFKHTELVTEQQDLRLFPRLLPAGQPQPREHTDNDEIDEPQAHDPPMILGHPLTPPLPRTDPVSVPVTRPGRGFRHAQWTRRCSTGPG